MKVMHSLRSKATSIEKKKVEAFVEALGINELQKNTNELEIKVYEPIVENRHIKDIHKTWKKEYLEKIETPLDLPRKSIEYLCKKGSRLIELSYIIKRTGGMASYYCFVGYFLSVIVTPQEFEIIDARGEEAS